jgi:glycine/D-amino acid oxidase-like deaminating enzyme
MAKNIDTIIVGLGLAGLAYAEHLLNRRKSFVVFSDRSQQASMVAGGLYNPVILKRFTGAWNGAAQLDYALPFYENLERKLGLKLDYQLPILRRFASIEEQNLWFQASDKPGLNPFLSLKLLENNNQGLSIPHKFGLVQGSGRVATKALINSYETYLEQQDHWRNESFDYTHLSVEVSGVSYKSWKSKRMVFAEGYGLKSNPFFNYLPLEGTKGEVITMRIPGLNEGAIVKSGVFIIPLGGDLYRVGSTYFWRDKTEGPTEAAKTFLLERLERFMTLPYEIVSHMSGVRPTVADRRPLVGQHPEHNNLFVLNGMGSRGVMTAPTAANALYKYIYEGLAIDPEMDVARFLP